MHLRQGEETGLLLDNVTVKKQMVTHKENLFVSNSLEGILAIASSDATTLGTFVGEGLEQLFCLVLVL